MEKVCPRCSSSFKCREDRIELCSCSRIRMVIGVRDYLKDNYDTCLCPQCIDEANNSFYSIGINPKFRIKQKSV